MYLIHFVFQYALLFKSLGSVLFFKESNTFIQEGCVKWIKGDSVPVAQW